MTCRRFVFLPKLFAVAVSTTFDDDNSVRDAAQLVWVRAITTENAKWKHWLGSPNLNSLDLFHTILDMSVYGKLLSASREETSWVDISADTFLHDHATMAKWGEIRKLKLI